MLVFFCVLFWCPYMVNNVSSMRATNPANKVRLLRNVASVLSLSVLIISVPDT